MAIPLISSGCCDDSNADTSLGRTRRRHRSRSTAQALSTNVEIPPEERGTTSGNPFTLAQAAGGQTGSLSTSRSDIGDCVARRNYADSVRFRRNQDLKITEVRAQATRRRTGATHPTSARRGHGTVQNSDLTGLAPLSTPQRSQRPVECAPEQPAWVAPEWGSTHLEKSNGSSVGDLPAGRLGGFVSRAGGAGSGRQTAIRWTAPARQTVYQSGSSG